ncbi:MAG: mercury methylation corrinoid protein HgcA [Desulfobacteraceae bacterium]
MKNSIEKLEEDRCKTSPVEDGVNISTFGVEIMASMEETETCASTDLPPSLQDYEKPGYRLCSHVDRFIHTEIGQVPVVSSRLGKKDLLSTFLVRCGINRHQYTVAPGLYAIGNPDRSSQVLVTANFKLTFDHLRKELQKINAWILVLDTSGVNVWCAAGKGKFSTGELVRRLQLSALEKIVDHKRVIVPQLGATGVSARNVKKQSGFTVVYGPIRAKDIPAFLSNGQQADKAMRQVTFTMYERFILTPVETRMALKPALFTIILLFIISGLGPEVFSVSDAWQRGTVSVSALAAGMFSGLFITPLLLPFVPSRIFAVKGIITGILLAVPSLFLLSPPIRGFAAITALCLFSVCVSSFLAMNFTGATPYTSPSGVEKEMKQFIPVQLTTLVLSCGLWIYSAF